MKKKKTRNKTGFLVTGYKSIEPFYNYYILKENSYLKGKSLPTFRHF